MAFESLDEFHWGSDHFNTPVHFKPTYNTYEKVASMMFLSNLCVHLSTFLTSDVKVQFSTGDRSH